MLCARLQVGGGFYAYELLRLSKFKGKIIVNREKQFR